MATTANPTHEHVPVIVLTEGVDPEELVPVGFACAECREELVSLVPRENPEYRIT